MKTHLDYLEDMLDYIHHLESFDVTEYSLLNDVKTQLAVRKAYEVLGEIIKRLPDDLLAQQPHIPWKNIKGMRDILIHRYDDIDMVLLWDSVQQLGNLRQAVEELIRLSKN